MRWVNAFVVIALGASVGCNKSAEEKYTPSAANARQALEMALTQWQSGQEKPAQFAFEKVKVEVVDQAWTTGQKLERFEIVSEEPNSGGPRVFSVKLKTVKGEQTAKYYVVGIDPLWIYGEADYRKLTGS